MEALQRARWFRGIAFAGAILAAAVVVLGAWVRLTDAGLGCPDWPGCYGHLYPQTSEAHGVVQFGKAMREMIHRYFATSLGAVIATLLIFAWVNRKDPDQPVRPVVALFAVVCLQGCLGALTVTQMLTPLIVTAHLLGGLTTLGLLCWLALPPGRAEWTAPHSNLRLFAACGLAALVVQIALGGWTSTNYAAVACPDFPTCQGRWWPPMDWHAAFVLWRGMGVDYEGGVLGNAARVAIHVTHRLGALIVGSLLLCLGAVACLRASGRVRTAGGLLIFAVSLQICLGFSIVHWGFPLPLATLHNAGAALLVIAVVALLRALWPRPSLPMVR